jgi:hypothetical protein
MTFKVIDIKTGKEPTSRVIDNIAKKGGLMIMDIDQFFVGEDGSLVLADDCGKMTYCDTKRFKVEPERENGKWIDGKCNKCGTLAPFWEMATTYYCSEYCPKCGADMREV